MMAARVKRKAAARKSSTRKAPARPTIFISYRHADPWTGIARQLHEALTPASDVWGADLFMDENDIEPAGLYDEVIAGALGRTTHFIALLTNSYWASSYCRKEIARAIERFENGERVRPLFVKAEDFDVKHFSFDQDRSVGRIKSSDPLVRRVGDLQFLGPFSRARRLERLAWEDPARLSDQLAQLVRSLGKVIA